MLQDDQFCKFEEIIIGKNPIEQMHAVVFSKLSTNMAAFSSLDFQSNEKKQNNLLLKTIDNSTEQPPIQKSAKLKKKRIRKYTSSNPNNKKGHWTSQQNLAYHFFLELNASFFIDSSRRKIDKIFKSMASFIDTRQAYQCRSHHQKIEKKWGSPQNILLNLRMENFYRKDQKVILKHFQRLGLDITKILSQQDLENPEKLFNKFMQQKTEEKNSIEFQLSFQKQEAFEDDNILRHHQQNCLCLMSQTYEDQLQINFNETVCQNKKIDTFNKDNF